MQHNRQFNIDFITSIKLVTDYQKKKKKKKKGSGITEDEKNYILQGSGFTWDGANKVRALGHHRSRTTVEQYMIVKHGITLQYPHLPCISVRRSPTHIDFFPIERMLIVEKQQEETADGWQEEDDESKN